MALWKSSCIDPAKKAKSKKNILSYATKSYISKYEYSFSYYIILYFVKKTHENCAIITAINNKARQGIQNENSGLLILPTNSIVEVYIPKSRQHSILNTLSNTYSIEMVYYNKIQ